MSNIHQYWIMNDGEVCHEDYVNDRIDESNDFTWPHTAYSVNKDLLSAELKHAEDDEKLCELILAYHHKEIDKTNWIID